VFDPVNWDCGISFPAVATEPRKIGFLADTHSRKPDGSDLPDQVLKAFKGTDLIVHLGDIGRHGILDRLGEIAPVMIPDGEGKGYVPAGGRGTAEPVKVIESGGVRVGLTFNLAQPDKKIAVDGTTVDFGDKPLGDLLNRRFKQEVDVVAFGGTHMQHQEMHEGILFFNPGSPTLPSDKQGDNDLGSVAILDVGAKKPTVKLIRLTS
jgi:putative phosphoesterase